MSYTSKLDFIQHRYKALLFYTFILLARARVKVFNKKYVVKYQLTFIYCKVLINSLHKN